MEQKKRKEKEEEEKIAAYLREKAEKQAELIEHQRYHFINLQEDQIGKVKINTKTQIAPIESF